MFARLPFILMLFAMVVQTFIGSFRVGSVVCLGVPDGSSGEAPAACDVDCGHDERAPTPSTPDDEHDDACPCTDIDVQSVEAASPTRDAFVAMTPSSGPEVAMTPDSGLSMASAWRGPPPRAVTWVATRQGLSVVRTTRLLI